MSNDDLKYVVYCRKSTESEDRQILSLDAQRAELDKVVKREKLKVVGYYTEAASAYKLGRLKFSQILQRIQDGEANAILVWQYNRIARNALDGGMIVHLLDTGVLKAIRTATSLADGTGNSKFMLQLEFAMSKKSSDDNSESVKRGNRAKQLSGWDTHKHAGYMFVEEPDSSKKILVPDPVRYSLIKRAIEMVLEYKMPSQVIDILNKEWGYRTPKTKHQGGKPMSLSNLYKLMHDEFYCGWVHTMDGQKVRGKHEPMITDEQYDALQARLGSKGKPRPKSVNLPYRGILTCGECGSAVCLEEKHQLICSVCKHKFASKNKTACPKCNLDIGKMDNPTRLHYVYGRCTKKKNKECSQKTIRIEALEQQIKDYLMSLNISPKVHDWVLRQLKSNTEGQLAINTQALANLQKVVRDVESELGGLLVQYTQADNASRQIISTDAYMKRKTELEKGKEEAEGRLADLSQRAKNFMRDTEEKFDFATEVVERFTHGDFETRTEIFRNLGSNLKLLNRKVLMTEDNLNLFIRKANSDIRVYTISPLEPEKSIDVYEKTGQTNPVISTLQAWEGSNFRSRFWRPMSYR